MSTCPHCAQQRYPDSPWTNEDHPLWMLTEVEGVAAMIREHDGVVRILGPRGVQTPSPKARSAKTHGDGRHDRCAGRWGATRPLLRDISVSCGTCHPASPTSHDTLNPSSSFF
jgi:hypothetical protein